MTFAAAPSSRAVRVLIVALALVVGALAAVRWMSADTLDEPTAAGRAPDDPVPAASRAGGTDDSSVAVLAAPSAAAPGGSPTTPSTPRVARGTASAGREA